MMMAADVRYYCERCGNIAFSGHTAAASYCCGCRQFLCSLCRGDGQLRCYECTSRPRGSRRAKTSGLPIVRVALSDADQCLTDLARVWQGVAADGASADEAAYAEREWALTVARIEADLSDAEHGLAGTHRRYRTQSAVLRRELDLKRSRVRAMLEVRAAELWRRAPRQASRWTALPPEDAAPQGLGNGRAASVMLVVLYVVVLSILVLIAAAPGLVAAAARLALSDARPVSSISLASLAVVQR